MENDLVESLVFLRSVIRNPLAVGALLPSSPRLSRLIASGVDPDSPAVVEVGAGTGPVTRELLKRGIGPERLFLIERNPEFVAYLQDRFPRVHVICGDAIDARRILARKGVGPINTVISSLPIRNLSRHEQVTTIEAMMKVLAPGGQLIQYSYGSGFPVPTQKLGIDVQRLGRVWMNVPPAEVWCLTRRI